MHLVLGEDDDDEGQEGRKGVDWGQDTRAGSSKDPQEAAGNLAPQRSGWDSGETPV